MDGLGIGAINTLRINIANIKLEANGASVVANTFAVAVANLRVENDVANIENALIISVTSDCLKRVERINAWKFLRLGSVEIKKVDNWVAIKVIMLVCKG